jgi:hypothetical protein
MTLSMHSPRRLASLLALSFLPGLSPALGDTLIDFEALQRGFQERRCPRRAACSVEDVLARDYLHLRLGAFDVHWPRAYLAKADDGADCIALLAGLVELQGGLLRWLDPAGSATAEVAGDLEVAGEWIQGLAPGDLAKAGRSDERDLARAVQAPMEAAAALQRLAVSMVDRAALGVAPQYVESVGLVLVPKRLEFMEWIGGLGAADAQWASQHWNDGASEWTQFWKGPTMFLALEYAPMTGFDPTFVGALPPQKLDKDGLRQHVLNQAARALLFRWFNRLEFAPLERALAANLVIGVSGRIAVLDGEGSIRSSGGTTAPYSRFVPGGLSEGGVLPPAPAGGLDTIVNSRWRAGKGADRFVAALREGQKDGTKAAAKERGNPLRHDKLAHFPIDSDVRGAKWLAHAPFLGPHAARQAYPEGEFLNDYREFFKSYQTAFYHWLESAAVRADGSGGAPFADFLRTLGTPDYAGDVDAALEQAYGLPVSGPDGSVDSLEWRFLAWLAAQGR